MPRGRRPSIDSQLIINVIINHKNEIVSESTNASIVVATDKIWEMMSEELSHKIQPGTLYSYVVNNRLNLKWMLLQNFAINNGSEEIPDSSMSSKNISHSSLESGNISNWSTTSIIREDNFIFTLTMGKYEFEKLIMETIKKYVDKKGKKRVRNVYILQPNRWTEIISKRLYDDFGLVHGYHFDSNYINKDKQSGSISGHCKCGSTLKAVILQRLDNEQVQRIKCTATKGDKKCGKRQCRAETRENVVRNLQKESVELYRSKKSAEIMGADDSIEPPHLYNATVLRTAKYQARQKIYRNPDPILALSKLKRSTEGQNVIRDIGLDPIIVYFWSPHQIRLYNNAEKVEDSRLCIDATGGLAKHYIHIDKKKSQHIFLYLAVLSSTFGQCAVSAAFSESQDTVTISSWLRRWIQSGARFPKEVTCDSSKALLNACCWAFTGYDNFEIYAEACMSDNLPRTYIRIDVAHYIKNWADFLKDLITPIKKFYLFGISQLILTRNKEDASRIIEALLLISLSETAGEGATTLKENYEFIKNLVSDTSFNEEMQNIVNMNIKNEDTINSKEHNSEQIEEEDNIFTNKKENLLQMWVTSMKKNTLEILDNEKGDDLNPRRCVKFAIRLEKHIKYIPLWSCIRRDAFGYGRIPASSAPVESEFKILKKQVIPNILRIDLAVETLVKYYNGKFKLISIKEKITHSEISTENSNKIEDNLDTGKEYRAHKTINCKEISPIKDIKIQETCLECLNGYIGPYSCLLCKAKIHALPTCSLLTEEYDEDVVRRVCLACHNSSGEAARISYHNYENWRGLGNPVKKRRSIYLNKNHELMDAITSPKLRALPIIKNGNMPSLGFTTIKDTKYSLQNTCAFDSMFQIILAAVTDNQEIKNMIEKNKAQNALFDLVLDVANTKINAKAYQKRAEIFIKFWKRHINSNSIEMIDCACNVVALGNFLFKNTPSFEEMFSCKAGCNPRIKSLPSITITDSELKKPLGEVIQQHIYLPNAQCQRPSCTEIEENIIYKMGDIIMLGVDTDTKTELECIPKTFICPVTGGSYGILGVVNYDGPSVMTRVSSSVGHYTAFAKRNANWVMYDDLRSKATSVRSEFKIQPELLLYAKI